MKLCLITLQAILLAVLVIQGYYINEVEAEKHSFSVGNWFNSIENKLNVQGMQDEYRKVTKTSMDYIRIPRRISRSTASTDNIAKAMVNNQRHADINIETPLDASDVTDENARNDVQRTVKKTADGNAKKPRRLITKRKHHSTSTHNIAKIEDTRVTDLVKNQELADINASDVTDEKGIMNDVYQRIIKTADDIAKIPRRMSQQQYIVSTDNIAKVEEVKISDLVNSQEMADINAAEALDRKDVTQQTERSERFELTQQIEQTARTELTQPIEQTERPELTQPIEQTERPVVQTERSEQTELKNDTENDQPPPKLVDHAKKKKRNKKHKKKGKRHELPANLSFEQNKAESGRRFRKEHKDRPRPPNKKKFLKMSVKESNSSGSDEHLKMGKPVDIIVHIKMSE